MDGYPVRRLGIDSRPDHVGFVVENVTLGRCLSKDIEPFLFHLRNHSYRKFKTCKQ